MDFELIKQNKDNYICFKCKTFVCNQSGIKTFNYNSAYQEEQIIFLH